MNSETHGKNEASSTPREDVDDVEDPHTSADEDTHTQKIRAVRPTKVTVVLHEYTCRHQGSGTNTDVIGVFYNYHKAVARAKQFIEKEFVLSNGNSTGYCRFSEKAKEEQLEDFAGTGMFELLVETEGRDWHTITLEESHVGDA